MATSTLITFILHLDLPVENSAIIVDNILILS